MGISEGFLSPIQVARYTGMKIETVRELMEKGELNSEELNGRIRIRKTELDRWLDEKVSPEQILKLTEQIDKNVEPKKLAKLLNMEEEKVEKLLKDKE